MRIVHLGINYWPDQTGIAPFAAGRCEYLAARGHQVVALSAPPFYPRWRIPDEYRRRPFVREEHHGVTTAFVDLRSPLADFASPGNA